MQTNVSRRRENKNDSKGFALISVLLLLLVLSGIAFALMYTVNTEQHLQRNDQGNGLAYYSAEAGMEKMMSDLGDLYNLQTAPTKKQIEAIACLPATPCPNQPSPAALNGTTFTDYSINVPPAADGVNPLCNSSATVSSGPNKGLIATICPMTLNVTAVRPGGEEVKLIRNVEIALIPVFQFGVFCNGDCSFFAGPTLDFSGRVHTNQNLFLAANSPGPTTFHDQIRVVFDVVRDTLANGQAITTIGYTHPVYIPTNTAGCAQNGGSTSTCRALEYTNPDEGSAIGGTLQPPGLPTAGGKVNKNWSTISTGAPPAGYNSFILAGPAVTPLVLPFVKGNTQPIEIIRRGINGELPVIATSRLYNKAQIRVLLSDDPAELPGGAGDAGNIRLGANTGGLSFKVPTATPGNDPTFIAEENANANDPEWTNKGYNDAATGTPPTQTKNLIDGYLRVEYRDTSGAYHAVTDEWLKLGFARQQPLPDFEHGVSNTVHPQAILLFQQLRDGAPAAGPYTRNDWYPINMYDQREGGFRDIDNSNCTINGVMNLVDIDVGNLKAWLAVHPEVEGVSQNGYILYFSDRRGMLTDPLTGPPLNPVPIRTGAYGFDDVVNEASSTGTPNGVWDQGEAPTPVGGVNTVNTWGEKNLGKGFSAGGAPIKPPSNTLSCATARKNWVSGARHGVRLVNGSLGNLPIRPAAIPDANDTGGFTLASENPAYIVSNYNANDAGYGDPHASAAVIADTVTLLSRHWSDQNSFLNPTKLNNRPAGASGENAWFRVAIASGKNRNFSWAATATLSNGKAPSPDFGTDGGVHNFLRFLEYWGGRTLNYQGSMVDLYYSAYATGVFKCCSTVYFPPTRKYTFDTEFQQNDHLPPGTPRFQDVVNIGFRQDFSNR